jgi:malate synthase
VEELEKIALEIGLDSFQKGRFDEAEKLFDQLIIEDEFIDFLTLPGYQIL